MQVHGAGYGLPADEKSDGVFGVPFYARDCYVDGAPRRGWSSWVTIFPISDSGEISCNAVEIGQGDFWKASRWFHSVTIRYVKNVLAQRSPISYIVYQMCEALDYDRR